ncbi:MAG: NADH-quinone oxidoreductase subunit H, partial [Planctomycetes bacterium]|nr:NADH-quinone oxidoreductase subunit H [Planctomycetota bacterium]
GVFLAFVVVPFDRTVIPADLDTGVFFFAAVMSIEALGVIMSGYASNNKWAIFGTIRLATQLVCYEIPLGLSLLTVVLMAGTLSVQGIVAAQTGGFWNWYVLANPFTAVAFLVFFTATLAECKRAPFDLPEAESELVAGFHTEYSGMRFSIFFLAEYAAMYVVSALGACLFLGGWSPGLPGMDGLPSYLGVAVGTGVLVAKAMALVFVQMWLRWTLPRIRLDHVLTICLQVLLPFSLAAFVGASLWQYLMGPHHLWFFGKGPLA